MARMGLSSWLRGVLTNTKRNAEKPTRRLRRWLRPPTLEILEDRLAPGSVVVAISELLSAGKPAPSAGAPESPATWAGMPLVAPQEETTAPSQDPWPIFGSSQDTSAVPVEPNNGADSTASGAFDWQESVNDDNLFRAINDVFAVDAAASGSNSSSPSSAQNGGSESGNSGGGGGPGLSGGSGSGAVAAGLGGGTSLAGAGAMSSVDATAAAAMMNASPSVSNALAAPASGAAAGTASSSFGSALPVTPAPSVVAPSAGTVSTPASLPVTPARSVAAVSSTPAAPAVAPVQQTVTPPMSSAPTNPAPVVTLVTPPAPSPDTPVLTTAQLLGAAGQNRLFVQGTLVSDAAPGTVLHLDFFGQDAALGTVWSGGRTLLGSTTVTVKTPGTVSFHAVVNANVPAGEMVSAVLQGTASTGALSSNTFAVADSGAVAANGLPQAVDALAPDLGTDPSGGQQPDVATLPALTTGDFVTLAAPGHPFQAVQALDAPLPGTVNATFPWGLYSFNVTNVMPGGSATVQMTLPADAHPTSYYKTDPVTGRLTPFLYDGHTGAEINGNVITLHLVDGGAGDADGLANGVIADPGGPGAGPLVIPPGLNNWTILQTGGSPSGKGTVNFAGNAFTITEGDSFESGMEHAYTIPTNPTTLTFTYQNLNFDADNTKLMQDAFEAAFVDNHNHTLVYTIGANRDSFFNFTEGQGTALGKTTTIQNQTTVTLDISQLAAGTTGNLILRLANNDGLGTGSVQILTPAMPPGVTEMLNNDTAPNAPNVDQYRHDLLTTDPTITGTATDSQGIASLKAQVDGAAPVDITSTLQGQQYTWNPAILASGAHTIVVAATNVAGLTSSATFTFTLDKPPVANAGGPHTVNQGSAVNFDGSGSMAVTGAIFSYLWTLPDGSASTAIKPSFTFEQNGTYNVPLTVTDTAGATGGDTSLVTVNNVPPAVTAPPNQTTSEGTPVAFSASFTDPGILDTHSASVNWGDGTTTTGAVTENQGAGTVTGNHTYLEEGTFTVTVTVTDNSGGSGSASFTVTSNDVPALPSLSGQGAVAEGASYALNLAAVLDPANDPITGWTITWGDGTSTTVTDHVTTVNHVYADGPGVNVINATATDEDGPHAANPTSVQVINVPPTMAVSGPATATEGVNYTLNLQETDNTPDAASDVPTSWQINWGDGMYGIPDITYVSGNPSTATHVYADGPGSATISATATNDDGTFSSNSVSVTILNAPPALTLSGPSSVNEGDMYMLNTSFSDTSPDSSQDNPTSWTINWGDGSISTASTGMAFHTYSDGPNQYTISATATNDDGTFSSNSLPITVNNVPPTITISGASSVNEGAAYTLNLSANDSTMDSASDVPVSWQITWGDGNVDTLTGNPATATHVYADGPSTAAVSATATNDDGTFSSNTKTVTVNNVPPTLTLTGASTINEGATYTLNLSTTDTTPDAASDVPTGWSITWGDGNTQTVSGNPSSVSHVYQDGPSTATISATATNDDGTFSSNTKTVTVNNVPPTLTITGASSINEGQTYTVNLASSDNTVDSSSDVPTSWTITWGDGTTTTLSGNPSSATHGFASSPNPYTITATATNDDGTFNSNALSLTVNNIPPQLTISGPSSVNEGATYTLGLSCVDNGVDAAQDVPSSWQVTWGDGNVQTVSGHPASVTHVYQDGTINYTISATATMADGDGTFASNTLPIAVNNVPPTVTISGAASVNEGATYTLTLASSDTTIDSTSDVPTGWTVSWGDGNTSNLGGNPSSATHAYADGPSTYTVSATATNDDGTFASNNVALAVNNVPPTITVSGANAVNEGATYTLNLATSDTTPDASSDVPTSWKITWGDGSVQTVNSNPASVTHVYADGPNNYTVSAQAVNDDGAFTSNSLAVTVNWVAPTLTVSGPASINEGASYQLNLAFSEPSDTGDDPTGWTIAWGDGRTSTLTGNPSSAAHTYAEEGTFTVTATATDGDGIQESKTTTLTVNDPAVLLTGSFSVSASECEITGSQTLATFTDPAGAEAVGDYGATIAWGDSASAYGTITSNSTTGVFTVSGSHAYAEDGTYTVTVTVTHDSAPARNVTSTVAVGANAGILLLDPTGDGSLTLNGNASVTVGGCGAIIVDSSASDAVTLHGHPTISAAELDITGNYLADGHPNLPANVATGVARTPDPLANLAVPSQPTTTYSAFNSSGGATTLQPGTYQGGISLSGQASVTLAAGLYYLKGGGLTMSGQASLVGNGVIIYNAAYSSSDAVSITGNGTVNLTPPASGTYQGIAFFQDRTSTATVKIAGNGTVTIGGVIYAAKAFLDIGGNGNSTIGTQLIGYDLTPHGNGAVFVNPNFDATKFYVADATAHATFFYDLIGLSQNDANLANNTPMGIASSADGSKQWVVDSNDNVYVYNNEGGLLGSWTPQQITQPTDITSNGTDVWIVDSAAEKVYRYANAAGLTSGNPAPASSFALNAANTKPSGLVVSGSLLWVTDDNGTASKVFVYNTSGTLQGSWSLDAANTDPSGITLNPGGGSDLWVVDRTKAVVYHYTSSIGWRSGSHIASDTFVLAAGNARPEGIADPPPAVTIQQPANNSAFPADGPVLISGHALPGSAAVSQVSINGSPIGALDAAGDFFSQVTQAQGQTTYTVTATDTSNQSASAAITVTGAAPVPAGRIDFTQLSDVTPSFTPSYGRTSFDDGTHVIYADLSAVNTGSFAIDTPLLVGVRNISAPSVRVRANDGVTPSGMPYYDYSKLISSGTVLPGAGIGTRAIAFYDPEGAQFTYQLVFLGRLNHPPRFISVPQVQWTTGGMMGAFNYTYQAQAVDPDANETLTYSLVYGPQAMQINSSTGQVSWNMPSSGTHAVGIQVSDGRGLTAEQDFVITVGNSSSGNLPPYFTTDPVVDANVNTPYRYHSAAADNDGDMYFTYSLVSGPAGLTIDSSTGAVTWTPTAAQLGVQNVTLQVMDMAQLIGKQTYQILVQNEAGNAPPIITTTAPLTVPAGQTYVYPVHAVDADAGTAGETLIYSLLPGAPTAMTEDQLAGGISWVTTTNDLGPHTVTVQVSDGRGGIDTQTFTVTVVAATGTGSIYGMKWNDLNANGVRDAAYINSPPTTLQPIDLRQVQLTHTPITIMYHQPTNSALIATFLNSNNGHGEQFGTGTLIERVLADGTEIPFATLPDVTLGDGIQMTSVQAGNIAGFTTGDLFAPVAGFFGPQQTDGRIVRVTNNGATVLDPWVTLPLVQGQVTEVYMDTTGAFGDNLLALTSQGELWEIDATGHAQVLATGLSAVGDGAFLTVPNNPTTYGPLAGKVLAISDGVGAITVDPQGNVAQVPALGSSSGEGIALIPATGNLFALADGDSKVSVATGQQFAPIQGQIVVAQESGAMSRVYFDGTQLQEVPLTFTTDSVTQKPWEQLEMFPAPLGPGALTLEPGLANWTIFLDSNNNGILDAGETFTKTDANGNYSFTGLQPGTYTVAEVQQTGWQQTAPASHTYAATLAANQTVVGQDFGNHQVPTGPNGVPVLTSNAPTAAVAGTTYFYNVVASDTDGDPLTFDLPVHPDGMAADTYGGVVAWKPTAADKGIHDVLLRVRDGRGGVALQSFQVSVTLPNTPPVITSTAPTPAIAGLAYQYLVTAQDAEQLPSQLTYHLDTTPVGNMILDAHTGILTWTPQSADVGTTKTITLDVSDGQGGDTVQTFNLPVVASGANLPVVITSTPRTSVQINQQYIYEIKAADADGDALTYAFGTNHPSGMTINAVTGVVSWKPTAAQFGPNLVDVQVDDHRGSIVGQEFTVQVVSTATNHPPTITSNPVLQATAAEVYAYNLTGSDPDGDPLSWSLTAAPLGMSVDPNLGTIRWTPTDDQVGTQAVTVRVVDPQGGFATQSYTITVRGENLPPVITSTPVFQVGTGQSYTYAVAAHDNDGDPLTYSLPATDPTGMQVSANGVISWTAPTTPGSFTVEVDVSDGPLTVAQIYTLTVSAPVDLPPAITSRPRLEATTGVLYTYQVTAVDPDGDTSFTYSLPTVPQGMTISSTGLIQWTPPQNQFMPPFVQVQVTDSANNTAEQYYVISVTVNYPPQIVSPPVTAATALTPYQYDVNVSDQDGDAQTYAVSGTPTTRGMTIDALGRITWSPQLSDVGSYPITVTVTDAFGATTAQNYTLTVGLDTTPPTVELQLSPTSPIVVGTQETFLVFASDNAGVASTSLTLNGVNVPIDANGQAIVNMNTPGFYNLVATATDTSGNVSQQATATLQVTNPNAQAPTVTINTLPNSGVVTAPETVSGTISTVANYTYTVTAVPFDGTPTRTLASGSGTPPGPDNFSTTFDPTVLPNGDYTIDVTVQDNNGNATTASQQVHVEGHLKLGDFTLSFTDLTIPVAGIPITITRTYDSLNAAMSSDFGYGWQLGFGDPKLKVDLVPGAGIGWGGYPAFLDGTRVYVTRPGGDPEGFTFQPYEEGYDPFGIITYWHPYFAPDPGVFDQLIAPDALLSKDPDSGEYYSIEDTGLDTYNPADPNYGGTYTLKNPQGLGYTIDATSGKLLSASNRHGNELTFSDTGIASNRGVQVTFTRDPEDRIIGITDPAGHAVAYSYDANGNLTSFTDRVGVVTSFVYRTDAAHYLQSVIDPLNRFVAQTQYYSDGRVKQVTDASGNVIQYSYDTGTLVERLTDQLGNTAETDEDAHGNVIRQVSPDGVVTLRQYNAQNLVTSETTVVGQNGLRTKFTYDSQGNLTSATDPSGNTTRVYYDNFGDPTSEVDAAGNATNNSFSTSGELTQTASPSGVVNSFNYDDNGDPTQSSNTQGQLVLDNAYNTTGNLTSSTPQAGTQTFYAYDADGNPIATWSFKGTGVSQVQVLDLTIYDADGETTGTERAVLPQGQFITQNFTTATIPAQYVSWTKSTSYDANGNVIASTNKNGLRTENTYDARGELIQVREQSIDSNGNLVWLDTRTVYDAAGREVASTDKYLEGATGPVRGTITTYNGDDQVIETDQVMGIVIGLVGTSATIHSVLASPGTIIGSATVQYDSAGRQANSTDENGLQTQTVYDSNGNVTRTRTESVDMNGQLVWLDTDTVYDSLGRVSLVTDKYEEGSSDPIYATETEFDDLGRAIKTIRLKGVQVNIVNGFAVLANSGTELWETQTSYDNQGRISETIAADGQTTDYEYDNFDRKTAEIGMAVSLADAGLTPQQLGLNSGTGVTVRLRTETVYDTLGRVQTLRQNIWEVIPPNGTMQINRSGEQDTTYSYDALGHVINTTYADGTSTSSTYDAFGRKTSDTNQLGQTRIYQYDADDRLIKVTLPAVPNPATGQMQQPVYQYAYDAMGNQTLIQDPLGRQTVFTYDGQGDELTRALPLGLTAPGDWTESFQYDARGRQTLHISFEGVVTQFIYDSRTGRLAQENFFESLADYNNGQGTPNEVWTFTYDAFGRPVQVAQTPAVGAASTIQNQYDGTGRVTQVSSPQGTLAYMYDDLGRKTATIVGTVANPSRIISYTYNAFGRLKTVTDDPTPGTATHTVLVTAYQNDLLGNILDTTLSNGAVDVNVYNNMNQLVSLTEYAPSNAKLEEFDYTLRADGTNAGVSETFWTTNGTLTDTIGWVYDSLNRLASEDFNSSDSSLSYAATYTYDLVGNRLTYAKTVPGNAALDETDTSNYDANDRLLQTVSSLGNTTTYGYSHSQEVSQVVAQSSGSSVSTTFTYDLQGNMKTATVDTMSTTGALLSRERLTYGYGASGIRVSSLHEIDSNGDGVWDQQTQTEYLNDPQNFTGYSQVLRETTSDPTTGRVTKVIDYTVGLAGIMQTVSTFANGQLSSRVSDVFGRDGLGSVRALTDITAAIAQIYLYDAFGNMHAIYNGAHQFISSSATNALTTLLYRGQQFDAMTGMQYLRARYYDPASGRFTQLDSLSGSLQNPQSLNKYLYANGNPIAGSDPSGREDLIALSVRMGINMAIGGIGAVALNGLRNYALGRPVFEGWLQAFVLGAALGGVFTVAPWVTVAIGGLGVLDSIDVAISVIRNPRATTGEKFAAIGYFAISVALLGLGARYANRFGTTSRAMGGNYFYSVEIPGRPLGTRIILCDTPNGRWVGYLAAAEDAETGQIRGRLTPAQRANAPEVQLSAGAAFDITPESWGVRFLYNIDENGALAIARDVPTTGHPLFGTSSKAAGELYFVGNRVYINDATGRAVRNLPLAQRAFEALGYQVETRDGAVPFPDQMPAGGPPAN